MTVEFGHGPGLGFWLHVLIHRVLFGQLILGVAVAPILDETHPLSQLPYTHDTPP